MIWDIDKCGVCKVQIFTMAIVRFFTGLIDYKLIFLSYEHSFYRRKRCSLLRWMYLLLLLRLIILSRTFKYVTFLFPVTSYSRVNYYLFYQYELWLKLSQASVTCFQIFNIFSLHIFYTSIVFKCASNKFSSGDGDCIPEHSWIDFRRCSSHINSHLLAMGKRGQRNAQRMEKDEAGCMSGLIRMFDVRDGRYTRKLLVDRKHWSRNPAGKNSIPHK